MELKSTARGFCVPRPGDDDHCDCDERCPKCGKKKKQLI